MIQTFNPWASGAFNLYSHLKPTDFYCKCSLKGFCASAASSISKMCFMLWFVSPHFSENFTKTKRRDIIMTGKKVYTAKQTVHQHHFRNPSCMFIIWTKTHQCYWIIIYYEILPGLTSHHLNPTWQCRFHKCPQTSWMYWNTRLLPLWIWDSVVVISPDMHTGIF